MAFQGWPVEAIEFFDGLEADNSKAYWQTHKHVYERCVKGPMEELLAELSPEFGAPKLFRPNRDVRFSNDKTPYKTNIAGLLGETGYLSLSSEGLSAGAGMVHLEADQLGRYRAAVDDDTTGAALEAIVAGVRDQGHDCDAHQALKTAPRGYARDHARIGLLRAKGLIMWHRWPPDAWFDTPEVKTRVTDVLRAAEPLRRWLTDNIGPTTTEASDRPTDRPTREPRR